MPAKKESGGAVRYLVLRDFGANLAGDILELDPAVAADLIRDGFIQEEEG